MLRDSRKIIARLRKDGFELVSVRGDHHKFRHPITRRMVIVPHPKRDLPPGTAQAIYRQAGWPKD
jgi:predicted RNA binding protein YcfA (HicA-like mRNA interferase family)